MRYHEPARRYVTRRLTEGKTRREIIRCLKRFVAREIFAAIIHPPDHIPTGAQIRAARLDAGISMTDLGKALGVTPITMSRLERELDHNNQRLLDALAHLASLTTSDSATQTNTT